MSILQLSSCVSPQNRCCFFGLVVRPSPVLQRYSHPDITKRRRCSIQRPPEPNAGRTASAGLPPTARIVVLSACRKTRHSPAHTQGCEIPTPQSKTICIPARTAIKKTSRTTCFSAAVAKLNAAPAAAHGMIAATGMTPVPSVHIVTPAICRRFDPRRCGQDCRRSMKRHDRHDLTALAARRARAVAGKDPRNRGGRRECRALAATHGPPADREAGGSHHRSSRTSGIPCAMGYRFIRDLPGDRLSCPRHRRIIITARLASASGCQDHTISTPAKDLAPALRRQAVVTLHETGRHRSS